MLRIGRDFSGPPEVLDKQSMLRFVVDYNCMVDAIEMSKNPHSFCYDNVNISTSIFVEQRSGAGPAKVTSGTFGILYGLRNAKWDDMLIAPIMKRFRACTGLDFNRDIRPSLDAFSSLHDQLIIVTIHCLGKYNEEFSDMFVSLLT
ncbi:hypothetical protein B0H14DRAFT_2637266 [Mycena olivaceomarginata]|nr:hypothetical protein B0H14DRAFT_2637266 [Mycena olivaceomarginata]